MTTKPIDWLYGLQHFGVKLGLENIRALLGLLGRPDHAFPSVLISGTNGKGSVATMIESVARASGLRTGMFTSPHLVRPTERIRLEGREIAADELDRRLAAMREVIEAGVAAGHLQTHPSFFEVITATALTTFRDHAVDVAVVEVGLGGRLDATNAVDAAVSVIVSIDLDHTKTLGGTLDRIAREKAGIIKRNRPVISGVVQQRAVDVLREVSRERDATLLDARAELQLTRETRDTLSFRGARACYDNLTIGLAGRHQIDNARVALRAFEALTEQLGLPLDPAAVRAGLAAARWPGRLQWIEGTPRLLLDAAHNPAGVAALMQYLDRLDAPRPVLLFGATQGKPVRSLLEPLRGAVERVVLTLPPVNKGIPPAEIEPIVRELFEQVDVVPQPAAALERARDLATADNVDERYVLVTGSLYLVGEILGVLSGDRVPGPVSM